MSEPRVRLYGWGIPLQGIVTSSKGCTDYIGHSNLGPTLCGPTYNPLTVAPELPPGINDDGQKTKRKAGTPPSDSRKMSRATEARHGRRQIVTLCLQWSASYMVPWANNGKMDIRLMT